MNIGDVMSLKPKVSQFVQEHPRFTAFFRDMANGGLEEGSVLEITMTKPDGSSAATNMRVNSNDLDLIRMMQNLNR